MDTQIITLPQDQGNDIGISAVTGTLLSGGMLQPQEIVKGYSIDGLLSTSGGEAEIYLCSKDNNKFVLKYYYNKKPNQEVLDKLKSFSHKNINSILDYGSYKDRFFIILEYAEGGALDDKLPGGGYKYLPLSEEEAKQVIKETADGFEACHKIGIIHRDIKPGNLLYRKIETLPDGKLKGSGIMVGDFGISSIFEVDEGMSKHLTETGARTEGYAAPEVYSGVIGPEVDYYSLGVTLWVLLTGMEPFTDAKGNVMYSSQIALDTIQGKTAENLLSRSPNMSGFFQKLIRGLLTVRHEKRWKYNEVTRYLSGQSVEIFNEVRTLPLIEVCGESCGSYQEIAQAIVKNPEEGKTFIFSNKLTNYLIKIDPKITEKVLDLMEKYSAEKREDEGTVLIAYSLCPSMAFPLGNDVSISTLGQMFTVLETVPEAILPFLRDERKGFYIYLEAVGLGEQGKRVKEIVNATKADSRVVYRIISAFQGNEINPFKDGINDSHKLANIQDLYSLPDYLKERAMIFIERNYGLLPAWIENVTGIDIDKWLRLLSEQKNRIADWGVWNYFILFMQGLESYDKMQINGDYILYEKDGKKGLFYNGELLYGAETGSGSIKIRTKDGTEIFSGRYAINFYDGFDKNGVSKLPFTDEEGRMTAFDGRELCYFNLKTGGIEPRYELKDGELKRLSALGTSLPICSIAKLLKDNNNIADMNKLIDSFWKKYFDENKNKETRDILLLIDKDNMDGLPDSYDFYCFNIGAAFNREGLYNDAIPYFQEAIALNPLGLNHDNNSYNHVLGLTFYSSSGLNTKNKAMEYFEKAMEITPDKPQPFLWKGICLNDLKNYNESIACLTMAIENRKEKLNNSNMNLALKTRAECYRALGMKDKADKDDAEAARFNA